MTRLGALAVGFAALVVLTGCSQATQPGSTSPPLKSDREINRARFDCLEDKGWPVRLEDGAISVDIPEAQQPRYRADAEECLRAAGVDPDAPLSDAQFNQIFESYSSIQKCLEKNGWSTPPRPSIDAFKANYDSDPWIPWSEIPGPELPEAGTKCPAMVGGNG